MKTSISNDLTLRRQDRPWTKAVARRLRDWLNGFLQEGVDSTEDDAQGFARSSLSVSAPPPDVEGEEQAGEGVSGNEEPIDPLLASFFEPAGPPEEWLKMVQEGAPQLLLPAERGGTPWQGSPTKRTRIEMPVQKRDEVIGNGPQSSPAGATRIERPMERRAEVTKDGPRVPFSSSNPAPFNNSMSSKTSPKRYEEQQVLQRKVPRSKDTNESTWIQRVKQRLAPGSLDTETKNRKVQRTPSVEQVPSTEKTQPSYKITKDVSEKPLAATRFSPLEPLPFPGDGSRLQVTPQALSTSPLKQRVERTVPTVPTNRTAAQARLDTEGSEHNLPRNSKNTDSVSATVSKAANVRQHSGERSDQIVSRPTVKLPNVEETLVSRRDLDYDLTASPRNVVPRGAIPSSPRSTEIRSYRDIVARKNMTAADLSGLNQSARPAAQRVEDQWPTISQSRPKTQEYDVQRGVVHEQEVYRDDPWPELPENQPTVAPAWAQQLREGRLRAVDLEQRGGI